MTTRTTGERDSQLRSAVSMQIDWEPDVTSRDISVAAHDGVITLTGFAPNYYEKIAAERAAKAVYGVKAVANDIDVRPEGTRTDPEIARDIVHAITADVVVPENRIKIAVKDGYVTLDGTVDWNFQRAAATACIHRILGVRGVNNNITLKPAASPLEVKARIEHALQRSAEVDSRRICVSASEGTVYLTGNVHSWFEKEEAERAAWSAPGVSRVVDYIAVLP